MDVIVVGSGLAGLSCAEKLQASGLKCLLLEADDRIGGRVKTDIVEGFQLDHGFQVLLTAYPAAQECFDYPALKLKSFLPGAVIRVGKKFEAFADPWRQPAKIFQTVLSSVGSIADKWRVAQLKKDVTKGDLEQLLLRSETTTESRLRQFGFSSKIIETFFRPFLSGIFLEKKLTTTSRKFDFVFRMFANGLAALPENGMQALPQQIANRLEPSSIRTNCRVQKIERNQVTLSDGQNLSAKAIVIAVDKNAALKLLGPQHEKAQQHEKKQTNGTNGTACLYFAADHSPIQESYLYLNGQGSGPINNLCVPSLVQPSYAPAGQSLISVSIVDPKFLNMDPITLENQVRDQLVDWFGAKVKQWTLLRSYFLPDALPAQDYLPAQDAPTGKTDSDSGSPRPDESVECFSTAVNGIFVCGDYLENASINGAIESGWKTAKQAQQWLAAQQRLDSA